MAKDVEVVTPTWISAVSRRSMGMGIGAERSAATGGVILPSKRADAQLLRLWMSESVSVASEENPGGWMIESVALIATAAVRDRALGVSGVWRPSAVRKSNFLSSSDGKAAAIRTTEGQMQQSSRNISLASHPMKAAHLLRLLALAAPALAFQRGAAPLPASRRCVSPAAQFELPDFSKMASDLSKMASPPESANEPSEDGEPRRAGYQWMACFN